MPENKHLRFFVILLYIALGLFAMWFIFRYALGWVAPFIVAFLLSRLIEWPVNFFTTKLRFPRAVASGIFTLVAFGGVGTALYFLISQVVEEIHQLVTSLPDTSVIVTQVSDFFNRLSVNFLDSIPPDIHEFFEMTIANLINEGLTIPKEMIAKVGSLTAAAAGSLPAILLFIIAVLVSTYFFSSDYPKIRAFISKHLPKKLKMGFTQTRAHFFKTILSYIRALCILICLTFVELSIGFAIMDIKYALVLAFFISLIDALPILGTGTILIPWALVNLITGDFRGAVGLAIIYGVITIARNLIEPKIVGQQIGLHPLVTLISIYIGIKLFGFIGFFMPIPIVLIKQLYEWGYFDVFKKDKSNI